MIPEKYQNKFEMLGLLSPFEEKHFNQYVCTGPQPGFKFDFNTYVGRVLQVRQKTGAFGSSTVLLQHADGSITSHENQCFWTVPFKTVFYEKFDEKFPNQHEPGKEYTIAGKFPATGFIVPFDEELVDKDAPPQSFSIIVTKGQE